LINCVAVECRDNFGPGHRRDALFHHCFFSGLAFRDAKARRRRTPAIVSVSYQYLQIALPMATKNHESLHQVKSR
jgi:hypothetical protein